MSWRDTFGRATEIFQEILRRPNYRHYLWTRLWRPFGYNPEQWMRVVYSREWREYLATLPLKSLRALEISPGDRPVIDRNSVAYYRSVDFPEFDIAQDVLSETFDIIIAEQVFEHVRHPYKAASNVRKMLKDDGIFLIATPFLIKIHGYPYDYTRWTPDGLRGFLEDCGFTCEIRSWGNKKAAKANLSGWVEYGWGQDLRNQPAFPACVWAYARKDGQTAKSSSLPAS